METFYNWMIRILKRISVLMLLLAVQQSAAQSSFSGNWETSDKASVLEIYEQGMQYYAKIVESSDPEAVGDVVLVQMDRKSDRKLFGGTYRDAELGAEYEAKLKLIDSDTIRITVLTGIFTKTVLWHRVIEDSKDTAAVSLLKEH